jgi:hypothetical protein
MNCITEAQLITIVERQKVHCKLGVTMTTDMRTHVSTWENNCAHFHSKNSMSRTKVHEMPEGTIAHGVVSVPLVPHAFKSKFACHAKWLCRSLHALVTMLRTEASHDPAAIPLPDDLDLPGGVSPLRYPDWLALAFHALKLCVPSLHSLQVLFAACFYDLHELASGWLTDVESQEFLLSAGFLRHIARAGAALGPPAYQLPPCYQLPPDQLTLHDARSLRATNSKHLYFQLPSTVRNCCRFRRL